ncbi:MAG: glycoside hydrolase family 18 protein [Chitinophagaceae bacterium]
MSLRSTSAWLLTAMLLLASACKKSNNQPTPPSGGGNTTISAPPSLGFYVVGYFPSYRDPAAVPDQKFRMCNVINYAFGNITLSGSLSIASPGTFSSVISKAKANAAKIFLSISGNAADFKNMASGASGRNSFVREIMQALRTYQLDGVDIDWEYPRTDDGTDLTYTAFMKELSDSCHTNARYYLSTAITSGKYAGAVRDAIRNELWTGGYVDFFNIMAYDDFSTTLAYKHHSDLALAQTSINYWVTTRGMPANKAVLGIPAYGRPSGITQTGTVLSYSAILAQGGSPLSDSARVSVTGFSNYMIYYNGTVTAKRKAMLAKTQASGVMLWEKGQDVHDASSVLKAICDTLGRTY